MSCAFDPELAPWVPMINDLPFADIAAARAAEKEMTANLPVYEPTRPVDVSDTSVPGPEGAPQVPVRIYTPAGAEAADGLPGLVYMHGGGYVLGSPDFCHSDLLRIADPSQQVEVGDDLLTGTDGTGIPMVPFSGQPSRAGVWIDAPATEGRVAARPRSGA